MTGCHHEVVHDSQWFDFDKVRVDDGAAPVDAVHQQSLPRPVDDPDVPKGSIVLDPRMGGERQAGKVRMPDLELFGS